MCLENAMCLENGDISTPLQELSCSTRNEDYQMIDRIKKAYEKRFWMEDFDLSNFLEDHFDKDILIFGF